MKHEVKSLMTGLLSFLENKYSQLYVFMPLREYGVLIGLNVGYTAHYIEQFRHGI